MIRSLLVLVLALLCALLILTGVSLWDAITYQRNARECIDEMQAATTACVDCDCAEVCAEEDPFLNEILNQCLDQLGECVRREN